MRPLVAALALLAIALALVPASPPAAAQGLIAKITGPPALAPSHLAQYNVTISGFPEGLPVNYTVQYYITGTNVTGGAPLAGTPGRTTGNRTTFRVNVTAPPLEQTLTVIFQIAAQGFGGIVENTTAETTIVVVKPIQLTVTFHNSSATAAVNVSVSFYVDDKFAGSVKVARFAGNADTTVSYDYLPVGLSAGPHTVRAEADLNGDGVIEAAQGEVAVSDFFYHDVQSPGAGTAWLLGIGVFAAVFLIVLMVRRRGQT